MFCIWPTRTGDGTAIAERAVGPEGVDLEAVVVDAVGRKMGLHGKALAQASFVLGTSVRPVISERRRWAM